MRKIFGPYLVDEDADLVGVVEGVAGDVIAPVDDEHAAIEHAREALGEHAAGKAGADHEDVERLSHAGRDSALLVHATIIVAIRAARDRLYPRRILEIPIDRPPHAFCKRHRRLPTELAADLAGVDGIASIVTGPVFDERDEAPTRGAAHERAEPGIEQITEGLDDGQVLALAVAADVVGLAEPAARQHLEAGGAVVGDVEPVADVLAVAVDGQARAFAGVVPMMSGMSFSGN